MKEWKSVFQGKRRPFPGSLSASVPIPQPYKLSILPWSTFRGNWATKRMSGFFKRRRCLLSFHWILFLQFMMPGQLYLELKWILVTYSICGQMIKPTDEMSQNKTGQHENTFSWNPWGRFYACIAKPQVRILLRPPGSLFRSLHNFLFYSDWSKNKQTAKQTDARSLSYASLQPEEGAQDTF